LETNEMPLDLPNLDDLTFDELVAEARAMIPLYAPEWTNHNPADPGITLVELLAYFTELLIYRMNRVSRASRNKFMQLLEGTALEDEGKGKDASAEALQHRLQAAVRGLRTLHRAVTPEDYEEIVHRHLDQRKPAAFRDLRVRCFERIDLTAPGFNADSRCAPGHVSIAVVPPGDPDDPALTALMAEIRQVLEPKRLLTTRLHVVCSRVLWIFLEIEIAPLPDADFEVVRSRVDHEIRTYLSPHRGGGATGQGWPFGQTVYLNEIYALIDRLPGVDFVRTVRVRNLADTLDALDDDHTALGLQVGVRATVGVDARLGSLASAGQRRLIIDDNGRLTAVRLTPFEVVGTVSPIVTPVDAL
jgi:hypothetical protein